MDSYDDEDAFWSELTQLGLEPLSQNLSCTCSPLPVSSTYKFPPGARNWQAGGSQPSLAALATLELYQMHPPHLQTSVCASSFVQVICLHQISIACTCKYVLMTCIRSCGQVWASQFVLRFVWDSLQSVSSYASSYFRLTLGSHLAPIFPFTLSIYWFYWNILERLDILHRFPPPIGWHQDQLRTSSADSCSPLAVADHS